MLVQAVAAWARYGTLVIAGIGLLAYLNPVPAIWLAYHYAQAQSWEKARQ